MPPPSQDGDIIITQKFGSAVAMQGDVLLRCLLFPGNTELFRYSFHTAFLCMQPIPGVLRLTRDQLDMNKRNKNINKLPPGFLVDMFYTNEAVRRAAAVSLGTCACVVASEADIVGTPPPSPRAHAGSFAEQLPTTPRTAVKVKSPVKRHYITGTAEASAAPTAAAALGGGEQQALMGRGATLAAADYDFSDDDDADEGPHTDDDTTPHLAQSASGVQSGAAKQHKRGSSEQGSVLEARLGQLVAVPRSAVSQMGQLSAAALHVSEQPHGVAPSVSSPLSVPAAAALPQVPRARGRTSSSVGSTHTAAERKDARAGLVAAANGTIMQGWMQKEGGFIRSWKERYFVLRQGTLSYYSDEASGNAKGVIDLRQVVAVRTCAPGEVTGRSYCLKLLSGSGRTYIFQVESSALLEEWVVALATVHGALMAGT
jgi:hypothetical protein